MAEYVNVDASDGDYATRADIKTLRREIEMLRQDVALLKELPGKFDEIITMVTTIKDHIGPTLEALENSALFKMIVPGKRRNNG